MESVEWKLRNPKANTEATSALVAATAGKVKAPKRKNKGLGLPGEGVLFDPIHYSKMWDKSTRRIALGLNKTFRINTLSEFFERSVPTVAELSCKFIRGPLLDWKTSPQGKPWALDWKWQPIARAGLSVQLLDLSSADGRSRGWLKFKMGINSLGRRERGFDIDRTYALPFEISHQLRVGRRPIYKTNDTRLYGEVIVRKVAEMKPGGSSAAKRWAMRSAFGVEQAFLLFGALMVKFRVGMRLRPDGRCRTVIDLK